MNDSSRIPTVAAVGVPEHELELARHLAGKDFHFIALTVPEAVEAFGQTVRGYGKQWSGVVFDLSPADTKQVHIHQPDLDMMACIELATLMDASMPIAAIGRCRYPATNLAFQSLMQFAEPRIAVSHPHGVNGWTDVNGHIATHLGLSSPAAQTM